MLLGRSICLLHLLVPLLLLLQSGHQLHILLGHQQQSQTHRCQQHLPRDPPLLLLTSLRLPTLPYSPPRLPQSPTRLLLSALVHLSRSTLLLYLPKHLHLALLPLLHHPCHLLPPDFSLLPLSQLPYHHLQHPYPPHLYLILQLPHSLPGLLQLLLNLLPLTTRQHPRKQAKQFQSLLIWMGSATQLLGLPPLHSSPHQSQMSCVLLPLMHCLHHCTWLTPAVRRLSSLGSKLTRIGARLQQNLSKSSGVLLLTHASCHTHLMLTSHSLHAVQVPFNSSQAV